MANLLSSIDTTVSAKNLASSLIKTDENGEYKTYFLNGEWGSGKTQFLKQVESQIEHPKFRKYHFRYIKLWETTDDKPVTEQIFRSLHPLLYWIVILSILISAISAVVYPFVEKVNSLAFLHNSTIYQSITKAFIPLTLIALTWKFVNYKSDYLYIKLLKCHNYLEKAKFPKNILIIDDFDRVDKEVQSQAYKAAYILQHKMPIIFVGNILNIVGATDNSIQKIIDVRIGLPFNLQPQNIWEEYLNNLSKYLGQNFDSSIYYIPVVENRNLRDRERLDYYLQKEFISRRKSEYTNIDQQFVIIYFYVFYPSMYDELVRGATIPSFFQDKENNEAFVNHEALQNLLEKIFPDREELTYPKPFSENSSAYFINEPPSNLSVFDAKNILNDPEAFKNQLSSPNNVSDDFYLYFVSNVDISPNHLNLAIQNAVETKNVNNALTNYIINNEQIRLNKSIYDISNIWKYWTEKLNKELKLDISEKIFFLKSFDILDFEQIGALLPKLKLDKHFENKKIKSYYLLTVVCQQETWQKFNLWDDQVWEILSQFETVDRINDFILFWSEMSVIKETTHESNFLHQNSEVYANKTFEVFTEKYDIASNSMIANWEVAINFIKPTLDTLEKDFGYHFKYVQDQKGENISKIRNSSKNF